MFYEKNDGVGDGCIVLHVMDRINRVISVVIVCFWHCVFFVRLGTS